jgi:hypothetical protein
VDRRLLVSLVGTAASVAAVAPGAAAETAVTDLGSSVSVTPKRSGTLAAPSPATIEGALDWTQDRERHPTRLELYLSRRLSYSSRGRPTCTLKMPSSWAEAAKCPERSVIGRLRAGGNPPFNAFCSSEVVLLNGGGSRLYVAALGGCALVVDEVTVGRVARLRHDPRWGYRLDLPLPEVFEHSTSHSDGAFLHYTLGRKPAGRGYDPGVDPAPGPSGYWRSTGCPGSGRHATEAVISNTGTSAARTRAFAKCLPHERSRRR